MKPSSPSATFEIKPKPPAGQTSRYTCSHEASPYMLSVLIKPTYPPSIPEAFTFTLSLFVWVLLLLTSNSPVSSFPSNFFTCSSASFPFFFLPHCPLVSAKYSHPVTLFIPCTQPSPPSSPPIYQFLLFFLLWLASVFFIGFSRGLYLSSFVLSFTSLTQPFSASQIALTGKR